MQVRQDGLIWYIEQLESREQANREVRRQNKRIRQQIRRKYISCSNNYKC